MACSPDGVSRLYPQTERGSSPQGEVTSKLELREDKLFITKTYEVNEDGKAYNSMQLSVKNHFIGTGLAIIKSIVFS